MRFIKDKTKDKWDCGLYNITKGKRYNTGSPARVKALGQYIYHCYFQGAYIAQSANLDDAKGACKEHIDKMS